MKSTFECLRPSSVNICTIITIIIIIKTPRKELELLQYTTTEIRGNVLLSSNVSLESSEKIAQGNILHIAKRWNRLDLRLGLTSAVT